LNAFRLDPANGVNGATFDVDYIRFREAPEPSTLAMLLGLGGLALLGCLWRRRRG
jgi:hypothetical protein